MSTRHGIRNPYDGASECRSTNAAHVHLRSPYVLVKLDVFHGCTCAKERVLVLHPHVVRA